MYLELDSIENEFSDYEKLIRVGSTCEIFYENVDIPIDDEVYFHKFSKS